MKKILECVMLIDDNEATNFFHKKVIEELTYVKKCIAVESGFEALEVLKNESNGEYLQPDIIFLDINMPSMTGWEFLEYYRELEDEKKAKIVIIMLTTSLNPDDKEKAAKCKEIKDFKNKPLTKEMFDEILSKYF